ncbi:MAG: formate-dependent phosphoribosylglycinamide formyltransferase [Pseudomonadota bacterium]
MIGTPYTSEATRVLLLGSGELGKELTMELQRLGVEVWACDRYEHAPAMQVAQHSLVFDMLNPILLMQAVASVNPHLIIPEVEAIATDILPQFEDQGIFVVPTARAVQLTMDREGIRRLAAEKLMVPTAKYRFAESFEEFVSGVEKIGLPCLVKPIMSSSGKGQSTIKSKADLEAAWKTSQESGRSGKGKVIIEEFVPFESEITLLTIRTVSGTFFCDPIGHKQEGGDYVESWQPHPMTQEQLDLAQGIAKVVTDNLGGLGLFGVELFLLKDGAVVFSEVSPRPHDTGMVTMATQRWSQFSLHARAILKLPFTSIARPSPGASLALRAPGSMKSPYFRGLKELYSVPDTELRLFGKPNATPRRRLGVVLSTGESVEAALTKARLAHKQLTVSDGI